MILFSTAAVQKTLGQMDHCKPSLRRYNALTLSLIGFFQLLSTYTISILGIASVLDRKTITIRKAEEKQLEQGKQ